jgi:predicted nucleic acid-binding protein
VTERWVVNASPVILLAKADVIRFLPRLCEELVIPAGVVTEIQGFGEHDAAVEWLRGDGARFVKPCPSVHPSLASWRGGAGEGEVISWALQNPGFTVVLDDRAARGFASRHHLPVIGSIRVIVLAKERGLIDRATPALEKLRGAGAWVNDELIRRAIELAGE